MEIFLRGDGILTDVLRCPWYGDLTLTGEFCVIFAIEFDGRGGVLERFLSGDGIWMDVLRYPWYGDLTLTGEFCDNLGIEVGLLVRGVDCSIIVPLPGEAFGDIVCSSSKLNCLPPNVRSS